MWEHELPIGIQLGHRSMRVVRGANSDVGSKQQNVIRWSPLLYLSREGGNNREIKEQNEDELNERISRRSLTQKKREIRINKE